MKSTASATIPVLVCTLAIFLLSAMDAGMKSLVVAAGVYNTILWRSVLATAVSASAFGAKSRRLPGWRASASGPRRSPPRCWGLPGWG